MAGVIRMALDGLVGRLADAGLSASLDPADIDVPGIWPEVDLMGDPMLDGSGALTVNLYLVAQDTDYSAVLDQWDDMLATVWPLCETFGDFVPVNVAMPGSAVLPGLRVTVRIPHESIGSSIST